MPGDVRSLITSLSAIFSLDNPLAINLSTTTSRSVSDIRAGGEPDDCLNSSISLRAMVGWSDDSP